MNNPIAAHALNQLRDIHLPPPVSNWPPAPGWVILISIVLIVLTHILFGIYEHWQNQRAKRKTLKKLEIIKAQYQQHQNATITTRALSTLLRRAALAAFPREEIAGLHGKPWLEFLNKTGKTQAFTTGPGRHLIEAPYAPSYQLNCDVLFGLIQQWVKTNV